MNDAGKRKKRLNWPAVLALMILLGGGGLAAVWQLKPELLGVFSAVGQSDAQEPGSADENPAPEEGSDAAPQNQYPVITLGADTVWVQAGSDFDPTANLTVVDPEDGELSYMQDSITGAGHLYYHFHSGPHHTGRLCGDRFGKGSLRRHVRDRLFGAGAGRGRTARQC